MKTVLLVSILVLLSGCYTPQSVKPEPKSGASEMIQGAFTYGCNPKVIKVTKGPRGDSIIIECKD